MNGLFVWGMVIFFIYCAYVALRHKPNNRPPRNQTDRKPEMPKISRNPRDIDKF